MARPSTLLAPLHGFCCLSRAAGVLSVINSHSYSMSFDHIALVGVHSVLARRRWIMLLEATARPWWLLVHGGADAISTPQTLHELAG